VSPTNINNITEINKNAHNILTNHLFIIPGNGITYDPVSKSTNDAAIQGASICTTCEYEKMNQIFARTIISIKNNIKQNYVRKLQLTCPFIGKHC
jgi:hypothetical protein